MRPRDDEGWSLVRRRDDIVAPPAQSVLDRVISAVSPQWGFRRAQARAALGLVMRHYEGGGTSRRTEGWRTPSSDANEAARSSLHALRNRCRDLYRNNAWAGRGIRVMTQAVVGTGIMLRFVDEEGGRLPADTAQELRVAWRRWALSKEIDADSRCNVYGLQRIAQRTLLQSGEVLVRRRWRRATDGLTVPLQLQILEGDYLDRRMDGDGRAQDTGERVQRINGIEFDALGRRRGYWLFRDHPGSGLLRDLRSVFVTADEILHLYRIDRPGQVVGIPPLAPAIVRVRDLDEYEDASLVRNKLAAAFAGYIRDAADVDVLSGTQKKNPDGTKLDSIEPGALESLPPGKDIVFTDPPDVSGYSDYVNAQLRAIAVSLDVTYEQLTGDLRGTNFTSGRMGWITHHQAVEDWRWDVLIPGLLEPLFSWFVLAFDLGGGKLDEDVFSSWTPPRREMIDPTAETAATIRQVRAGLSSLSEAHREQGYERDEVLGELADDMNAARELGLMLETDTSADANRKPADTTGDKNSGGRNVNKTAAPKA